jgi:hypothetical protein
MFVPKTEYFDILSDAIKDSQDIKNYSTVIYTNQETNSETDFYNQVEVNNLMSQEPLFMNRCIEFINDANTSRGGIDQIMNQMRNDKKIFISNKIEVDYTSFDDIKNRLKNYLLTLYALTNKPENGNQVRQFYGPIYVLMTQYPFLRTIPEKPSNSQTCDILPITLQMNANIIGFSPKIPSNNPLCTAQNDIINSQKIRMEMYVIMPLHAPSNNNATIPLEDGSTLTFYTVGPFVYRNWSQIKCNMRRLFAYNPNKKIGVAVVHPRSRDNKCFLQCGNAGNPFGYVCGARNNTVDQKNHPMPYASTILGTPLNTTDPAENYKYDYANLYVLNNTVFNTFMGMDSYTGFLSDCIKLQEIPTTYTVDSTEADCAAIPMPKNLGAAEQLADMEGAVFTMQLGPICIGVNNSKKLIGISCDSNELKKWQLEPQIVFTSPTTKDKYYFIYMMIKNSKGVEEKWYLNDSDYLSMTKPRVIFYGKRSKIQYTPYIQNNTTKALQIYQDSTTYEAIYGQKKVCETRNMEQVCYFITDIVGRKPIVKNTYLLITESRCLTYKLVSGIYQLIYDTCDQTPSNLLYNKITFTKVSDVEYTNATCPVLSDDNYITNLEYSRAHVSSFTGVLSP